MLSSELTVHTVKPVYNIPPADADCEVAARSERTA